jgi:hypothetical protein
VEAVRMNDGVGSVKDYRRRCLLFLWKSWNKMWRPIRRAWWRVSGLSSWIPTPWGWFVFFVAVSIAGGAFIWLGDENCFSGSQWNLMSEAWGIISGGVVLWWILTQKSEAAENRAWLRSHIGSVKRDLDALAHHAANVLLPYGVPMDAPDTLLAARTADERQRLAETMKDSIEETLEERIRAAGQASVKVAPDLVDIEYRLMGIEKAARDARQLLDRFYELESAAQRCLESFADILEYQEAGFLVKGDSEGQWVMLRICSMTDAAVDLLSVCSDLLQQAGIHGEQA